MRQRFLLIAIMLCALATGLATPSAADDQTACFNGGAADQNIAACTRMIASNTLGNQHRARAHLRRGFLYSRRAIGDDFDRAIADADEAIQLDPTNALGPVLRAAGNVRKGNLDRAFTDLNEGLRRAPRSSTVHNIFGNYYFVKGDYDRALAELNEALQLDPNNYFAIRTRGLVYEKKNEFEKALSDLRAALRVDPQRSENLGREAAEGIERVEKRLAAQRSQPAAQRTQTTGLATEAGEVTVDGQTRTYLLARAAAPGPRPTIILLHGAGGSGARLAQTSDLERMSRQGFAAVFPEGRGARWNYFPPGKEPASYRQAFQSIGGIPDDVAFVKMLIADLVRRGTSDAKRIYLAGISAGGIMTLRIACADAELLAAIAVFIAGMPESIGAGCQPARPIPALMLSGTADPYLPFGGGPIRSADRRLRSEELGAVWSMERLADFLRRLNGCSVAAEDSVFSRQPQKIEVTLSKECPGGPVVLYRVVGGGHNVPAGANASQMLVDFFRDKTR